MFLYGTACRVCKGSTVICQTLHNLVASMTSGRTSDAPSKSTANYVWSPCSESCPDNFLNIQTKALWLIFNTCENAGSSMPLPQLLNLPSQPKLPQIARLKLLFSILRATSQLRGIDMPHYCKCDQEEIHMTNRLVPYLFPADCLKYEFFATVVTQYNFLSLGINFNTLLQSMWTLETFIKYY